jgi:serine acetyltransferase
VLADGRCTLPSLVEQLNYLRADFHRATGGRPLRWLPVLLSQSFTIVAWYRLNRAAWLALGEGWSIVRGCLAPLITLIRPWLGTEIDYRAEIGPGLLILHPSLGIVVNSVGGG